MNAALSLTEEAVVADDDVRASAVRVQVRGQLVQDAGSTTGRVAFPLAFPFTFAPSLAPVENG
jgi:hypothetical protein